MAKPNPHSALRTPHLKRLVPLLLDWFAANARDLPWRRTRDPYAIWVSEIMLQQTQVKTVIPFWNRWMRELPTIQAVTKASPAKIHKLWEGLGYYTRVRNLQKAAKKIVTECRRRGNESKIKIGSRKSEIENPSETPHVVSCKFPENFDDVLALPGIGRYTAGAICSIAFNQPTPILDGNVIRVLTRVFGIAEDPKEKKTNARLWKLAEELVSNAACVNSSRSSRRMEAHSKFRNSQSLLTSAATIKGSCSALNQSLMELGALVCTPRNPQCGVCPVRKLCVAFRENRINQLPNFGKRETATARRFVAFIVERDGRFLVRQRPDGIVNANLWEFPNIEIEPSRSGSERQSAYSSGKKGQSRPTSAAAIQGVDSAVVQFARHLGLQIYNAKHLSTVKHSITRYRITLEGYWVQLRKPTRPQAGVWKSPAKMRRLAFTAAHKKLATIAANRILSGR